MAPQEKLDQLLQQVQDYPSSKAIDGLTDIIGAIGETLLAAETWAKENRHELIMIGEQMKPTIIESAKVGFNIALELNAVIVKYSGEDSPFAVAIKTLIDKGDPIPKAKLNLIERRFLNGFARLTGIDIVEWKKKRRAKREKELQLSYLQFTLNCDFPVDDDRKEAIEELETLLADKIWKKRKQAAQTQ